MINTLYERGLPLVLNDQNSNFKTWLAESSDICNHPKNIHILIYDWANKIQNNLAPPIMEIMLEKKNYSIWFKGSYTNYMITNVWSLQPRMLDSNILAST